MKKIIILTIMVLFLLACEGQDGDVTTVSNPFVGGSQGIIMNFQDFRSEVFDGGTDPFSVVVRLENKGETLVEKSRVKVRLSGFNPAQFGRTEAQLLISPVLDDVLETRKEPSGNIIPGPPVFVEFSGLNHASRIAGAVAEFPLRAELCYAYASRAVSKLCIRENVLSTRQSLCEVTESKSVFNSGSPVQVRNFQEASRGRNKVGFSFDVVNVGDGSLYQVGSGCDTSSRAFENKARVRVVTSLPGLQCTGLSQTTEGVEGEVTLYNGQKTITCSQDVNTGTDFEQIVGVEVGYDYNQITQTTLRVQNSGE
ncbi:hypothetical protein COV18_03470 [Candidatus Woesearchaeota archaeon CG10_big_fil_rev_8_21_14_0_10_37_12]|nr:MAG: hypothetical protein COV18_03470 [Candidatus Woesearchaeota archaeon CG10_big_fil_rev_8_21_14_0_10_37_12]